MSIGAPGYSGQVKITYTTLDSIVGFPVSPLDIEVDLFIDGVWTEISTYVYTRDQIHITRGIPNEGTTAEPSSLTLTLNNRSGRFTPRNPLGPYYGKIGRNTPIRVLVGGAVRFTGEVSSWPQKWDQSGADVYTQLTAAGILRRLGSGQPVKQTGVKTFAIDGNAYKYWPGDTKFDTSRFKTPLTLNNCALDVHFGQGVMDTGLPVGMLIDKTNLVTGNVYPASGFIKGVIGAGGGATFDAAGFVFKSDGLGSMAFYLTAFGTLGPGGYVALFDAAAKTLTLYRINYDPDIGYNLTLIGASAAQSFFTDGAVHSFLWKIVDAGATLTHTAYIDGVSVATGSDSNSSVQGMSQFQLTYDPTTVTSGSSVAVSYLTFWADQYGSTSPDPVLWAQVADGYIGETAGNRLSRLCTENGISFSYVGDLADTSVMGAQASSGLLSLLQESATTDGGVLYEPRGRIGLEYRTRKSLYNQSSVLTLDYSTNVFNTVPEPIDDDQGIHNDITVSNSGGGSVEAKLETGPLSIQAPPNGINTYGTSVGVNLETDGLLDDQASWHLALGTVDEARFPSVGLSFANPRIYGNHTLAGDIVSMNIGQRLTIENLPAWIPPDDVSLLALGYTEDIWQFDWDINFNCTPASPYDVAVYGVGPGSGPNRYDTGGSELSSGGNSSVTSLSVQTTEGELWTTDAVEFPFDVNVGGEQVTVTGITGGEPSFVGVGTAATGNNASVTPGLPAGVAIGDLVLILASIRNTGAGTVNTPTNWTSLVASISSNVRLVGRVYDGVWTMPAVTFTGGVANADTIAQSCALRNVEITPVADTTSGTNGSAQNVSGFPLDSSTYARAIAVMCGWKQDDWSSVTPVFGFTAIQSQVSTAGDDAGQTWCYEILKSKVTSAVPAVSTGSPTFTVTGGAAAVGATIGAMLNPAPQTFTVIRHVNGVVKSHVAGEKVRLWNTPRYAL